MNEQDAERRIKDLEQDLAGLTAHINNVVEKYNADISQLKVDKKELLKLINKNEIAYLALRADYAEYVESKEKNISPREIMERIEKRIREMLM